MASTATERKLYPSSAGKRNKKLNQRDKENRIWIPTSTNGSSSGGFIHLFLPLQLQQQPEQATTTTTTSPPPSPPIPEVLTQRNNNKKQQQQQKKRRKANKKKKKKKKHHPVELIDQSQDHQQQQQRQMNSLQLLQDDGIPPLLNSLSTDETQQWARWLRCTLCLKVQNFFFLFIISCHPPVLQLDKCSLIVFFFYHLRFGGKKKTSTTEWKAVG